MLTPFVVYLAIANTMSASGVLLAAWQVARFAKEFSWHQEVGKDRRGRNRLGR